MKPYGNEWDAFCVNVVMFLDNGTPLDYPSDYLTQIAELYSAYNSLAVKYQRLITDLRDLSEKMDYQGESQQQLAVQLRDLLTRGAT